MSVVCGVWNEPQHVIQDAILRNPLQCPLGRFGARLHVLAIGGAVHRRLVERAQRGIVDLQGETGVDDRVIVVL
jgi:hypothetical protein